MQTTEKNNTPSKSPKQLFAELKDHELAKVVHKMDSFAEGLRPYQESINYCICAISVSDKEPTALEEKETAHHIKLLYILSTYLRAMEDIITGKSVRHE